MQRRMRLVPLDVTYFRPHFNFHFHFFGGGHGNLSTRGNPACARYSKLVHFLLKSSKRDSLIVSNMHVEVADFISDDAPNTATQEVQKTQRADMDHQARAPWTCGRQVLCEWQNFDAKRTKRARIGLRIKQQRLKSPPLPTILYTI